MSLRRRDFLAGSAGLLAALSVARPALASTDQETLVSRAAITIDGLRSDPSYGLMDRYLSASQAVLIVPELLRAGFIFGGEGGSGVLLRRHPELGWSYPAFYLLIGGSVGFQIGGQISEIVVSIMSQRGLMAILDRRVTLGVDLSGALGPVGAGAGARTGLDFDADSYVFSRNQGLYAGGKLDGTVIQPRYSWNESYYGAGATPGAILDGRFTNSQADTLRSVLP
ncbi:lipid-binding SYLF domain-containing protein [Fodinicurvata sp. EGI_FJ10296]|uniref:lipid-binding SYLF domain-containing protein n=1 Tax=Fodinicurvata sp. EGI_FJ10296 TaxID=3231908 RepID=UPI003451609F